MKSWRINVAIFPGGNMQKPMRFFDTLDAEDERSAMEKGIVEYAKEYPNDVIAVEAEEIEQTY